MTKITGLTSLALLCLATLPAGSLLAANESYLRIACDGADAGAEVSINGVFKGECPLDTQVKPGLVKITAAKQVDANTERGFEQELKIGEGVLKRIDVTLSEPRPNAAARAREAAKVAAAEAEAAAQKKREAEEVRRLVAAAEKGDPASTYALGEHYEAGTGVARDLEKAQLLYRRAAQAGHAGAQGKVAIFAYNGWTKEGKNLELAREFATRAADGGDGGGMLILFYLYDNGAGGLPKDAALATQWMERAAAAGNPRAITILGWRALAAKDYERAWSLAKRAAANTPGGYAGDRDAVALIGKLYNIDWPGHAKNASKAMEWFLKAVDAGSDSAMNEIGVLYRLGIDGVKDEAKAGAWWARGAAAGNTTSMLNLSTCYAKGLCGVQVDKLTAIEWCKKALAAGDERARADLEKLLK